MLDDSHHLGERILRSGRLRLQAFANGVFTWPRPRGERLIDDDDVGAPVALIEESAGEQSRAERAEIVRGRAAAISGCALPVAGSRLVVREGRQRAAAGEWQLRCDADMRHARKLSNLLLHAADELGAHFEPAVLRDRERHAEGQDVPGVESRTNLLQRDEASHHQSRTDQQHEREGHFRNHEHAAHADLRLRRGRIRPGPQRPVHVDAGGAQRRDEAERERRRGGDADSKQQNVRVDPDGIHTGQVRRIHPHEPARTQPCEEDTKQPAKSREHQTLRRQLPQQPAAARAKRTTHCQFTFAGGGAREQQVGDIRTGNQQEHADRPEECDERGTHVLDHIILQCNGANPHPRQLVNRVLRT